MSACHERNDRGCIEACKQWRGLLLEIGKPLPIDRQRIGQAYGLGVLEYAVHAVLVMKMRAGCTSRHADVGDDLALGDAAADVDAVGKPRQMSIDGDDARGVVDLNDVAVAAVGSRIAHPTLARGVYWCADGSGVIDTLMGTDEIQDGMHSVQIES